MFDFGFWSLSLTFFSFSSSSSSSIAHDVIVQPRRDNPDDPDNASPQANSLDASRLSSLDSP